MEPSNYGEIWGGTRRVVFSGCKRRVWYRVVESN